MVTFPGVLAGRRAGVALLQARLACEDVVRASFRLIDQGQATKAAGLYAVDGTLTLSDATQRVANVTLRGADIHAAMRQREASISQARPYAESIAPASTTTTVKRPGARKPDTPGNSHSR